MRWTEDTRSDLIREIYRKSISPKERNFIRKGRAFCSAFYKAHTEKQPKHTSLGSVPRAFLYALRNLFCGRGSALFLFAALEPSDYVIGTDFTAVTEIVEMLVL